MPDRLSDLSIQLELSEIHRLVSKLRQQIEPERTDPEDGPLFAYLKFAEKSLESAAGTLNPKPASTCEAPKGFGPRLVPDNKRWSLFGS